MRKIVSIMLSLAILLGALSMQAWADKKEKVIHPLQVMKASIERNRSVGPARSVEGRCTIWLKNISHDDVDGIKVVLKLREGSREIHSLEKTVDEIKGGKKAFLNYSWEDFEDRKLTPQIWVTYNGEEGPVTFQGEPPVW